MKKSPKLYLVVGLALLVAGLLAIYLTVAVGVAPNNVQTHVTSGTISEPSCRSCHERAYQKAMRTGDVSPYLWFDAHYTHQERTMGLLSFRDKGASNFDGCGKCHSSTSVRSAFGEVEGETQIPNAIRKQVNPGIPGSNNNTVECLDCHGTYKLPGALAGTPYAHQRPAAPGGSPDYGCMQQGCHGGTSPPGLTPAAAHTGVTYIGGIMTQAQALCLKCHGGVPFYPAEETNKP